MRLKLLKELKAGKNKTTDAFSKSFISMESIFEYFEQYKNEERQLRDFIDLDATFRSINGEHHDFEDISLELSDEIFEDQEDEDNNDKENEDEAEFENES